MYNTIKEATQDPNFEHCKPILHLPANEIEKLEWQETTKDNLPVLLAQVDFVPAKMYPAGLWHETGELGHDFKWRYFTNED